MLGETVAEVATTDLPGFSAAAVAGHSGRIRSVRAGEVRALVFLSRTHYYEGRGVAAVVHGVRTAARAGCRTIVLTNGCGGLKETWTPGTPVLISDHINLTGRSPIVGATFVDLTDLYSARLRALCREVDPTLDEGVYVQFPGPHYAEDQNDIAIVTYSSINTNSMEPYGERVFGSRGTLLMLQEQEALLYKEGGWNTGPGGPDQRLWVIDAKDGGPVLSTSESLAPATQNPSHATAPGMASASPSPMKGTITSRFTVGSPAITSRIRAALRKVLPP